MPRNPRRERPTAAGILERFGYEDGDECSAAPDGWHALESVGMIKPARCFWCGRWIEEDQG